MELRQIQTFVAATQTKSFTKAAEYLGYSQSAVTVQIRLLEHELNTKLFDRMGKGIELTAQGRQFLDYANTIIREMNRAKHFMRLESELHAPLHIGTLESLCFSKLPQILFYFREHHPKVAVQITTATPKELIEMMENNRLDLIYILDRPRYSDRWNKVMEIEEPIVFVASAGSDLAQRRQITLHQLLDRPFFLTERNENYRRELDNFLESKGIEITPFLEISNTEFIIKMIERDRGISYLPRFAVQDSVDEGRLSILDVPEFQKSLYRQIFYHTNKWKTPEVEEFIRLAGQE